MTSLKPARPSRSGFSFAVGEHRRRLRVELAATEVGSTAPAVLSRPSPRKREQTGPGPIVVLIGPGLFVGRAGLGVARSSAGR
jgi:hypothetical protein